MSKLKMTLFSLLSAVALAVPASARWSVGIEGGVAVNRLSADNSYFSQLVYDKSAGFSVGVPVQYQFVDWFALRAEALLISKNYRIHHHAPNYGYNMATTSTSYLDLPVAARISFGGKKLRGFFDAGAYVGYWLSGRQIASNGVLGNPETGEYTEFYESRYDGPYVFNEKRDNRFDAGLLAGAGILFRMSERWTLSAGCRFYYGLTDLQKNYMYNQIPRYETSYNLSTFEQIFESYWNAINNNYAFWEIDPTDWDAVYDEYLPKFAELDTRTPETEEEILELYAEVRELYVEMTSTLIDGHYNLSVYLPSYRFSHMPAMTRLQEREGYHDRTGFLDAWGNANAMLQQNGRFEYYMSAFTGDEGDNENKVFATGLLDTDIVYVRITDYNLRQCFTTREDAWNVYVMYKTFFYQFPEIAGVIIDVRGNYGGANVELPMMLSPLLDEPAPYVYTRHKNGPGRLDYTPWTPQYLIPLEEDAHVDVPFVVLADMNSISLAEHTALAAKALPNGVFIGENTFGGQGTIMADNKYFYDLNGGYVYNYAYQIYTTMTMTKALDGNVYEGVGVTPDIECAFDPASFAAGVDNQLERAVQYIRNGE